MSYLESLEKNIAKTYAMAYEQGVDHSIRTIVRFQSQMPQEHNLFNSIIEALELVKEEMKKIE